MRASRCHLVSLMLFLFIALVPLSLWSDETLRTGDLIFQDLACGELCDAIETVTKEQFNVQGPALSHVGVVIQRGAKRFVFEAYGDVITLTPIEEVMARKQDTPPRIIPLAAMHGLSKDFRQQLRRAAAHYVGKPYDDRFVLNDGAYYCSELVYEIFKEANGGKEFFHLAPMAFGAPGSAARKTWERYFEKLGMPIPKGAPGISPLGIWLEAIAVRRHR